MKTPLILIMLVGGIGALIYHSIVIKSDPISYVKQASTVEVIEVEKEAWMTDEDAVKAAQDVIKKKELQAELTTLEASFASSTEVYKAEEKAYKAKKVELEKELGTYWTVSGNVKRLIRETFPEDPETAIAVAMAESGMRMVQSNHNYPKDMDGQKSGSRERSFCIYQIHEPAHAATATRLGYENYKTDIEHCVKMARVVYEQAGHSFKPWTVYVKKMHLAYVR